MIGNPGKDMDELRMQSERMADEMDSKMSESFAELANSFTLKPNVGKMLVSSITSALKQVGADIEGDVTSANDPAVIRGLSAISDMIEDAIEQDILDEELAFEVSEITGGDDAARLIIGKIASAFKDKGFIKYMKQPTAKSEMSESEQEAKQEAKQAREPSYEMDDNEIDKLFKARI